MTSNVHESTVRAARYAQHVADLARAFNVEIEYLDANPEASSAGTLIPRTKHVAFADRRRCATVPRVIDATTYAVALHELGHCIDPLGMIANTEGSLTYRTTGRVAVLRDMHLILTEEEAAWNWAKRNSLEWTAEMVAVVKYAFGTYRAAARQLGIRR